MRKIYLLTALLAVTTVTHAQWGMEGEHSHEFKVGIGLLSAPQISGIADVLSRDDYIGGILTKSLNIRQSYTCLITITFAPNGTWAQRCFMSVMTTPNRQQEA
jgi:hypothetical protein